MSWPVSKLCQKLMEGWGGGSLQIDSEKNYKIPKRKPRCMPFTESSLRTTQTVCPRYVTWATRSMRLPALDTLHPKRQHQQTTFTVSPVTAEGDRSVRSVSLSLIFLCQPRNLTFGGTISLSKANMWAREKSNTKLWIKQNERTFSNAGADTWLFLVYKSSENFTYIGFFIL